MLYADCDQRNWECFYQPFTNCTLNITDAGPAPPLSYVLEPESHGRYMWNQGYQFGHKVSDTHPSVHHQRPMFEVVSAIMRFIMRPNLFLASFIRSIERTYVAPYVTQGSEWEHEIPINETVMVDGYMKKASYWNHVLSVHIRLGDQDKYLLHTVMEYVAHVRALLVVEPISAIFISSDDFDALEQFKQYMRVDTQHKVDEPYMNMLDQTFPEFLNATRFNGPILTLPERVFSHNGNLSAADHLKYQEGYYFMAELYFFSWSRLFVGTLISNIGRTVYEMQAWESRSTDHSLYVPNRIIDVDHNQWFFDAYSHPHWLHKSLPQKIWAN